MNKLLSYHKLKLLLPRHYRFLKDTFEGGVMFDWKVKEGDWHIVTVDTNVDSTAGLDGDLALNCLGSYYGGIVEKQIRLNNYGEVIFEFHTQNPKQKEEPNSLTFSVDGVVKLKVDGPTPWQRCIPIGLTPGTHNLSFEYKVTGEPNEKKAIIDSIYLYQAKTIDCIITDYTPPKPIRNLNANKTLRGYTRYQEMTVADTEITFTATMNGLHFQDFMQNYDSPFYFVDEFGVCYRGIFVSTINPTGIALNEVYTIELSMIAGQKTGIGFC